MQNSSLMTPTLSRTRPTWPSLVLQRWRVIQKLPAIPSRYGRITLSMTNRRILPTSKAMSTTGIKISIYTVMTPSWHSIMASVILAMRILSWWKVAVAVRPSAWWPTSVRAQNWKTCATPPVTPMMNSGTLRQQNWTSTMRKTRVRHETLYWRSRIYRFSTRPICRSPWARKEKAVFSHPVMATRMIMGLRCVRPTTGISRRRWTPRSHPGCSVTRVSWPWVNSGTWRKQVPGLWQENIYPMIISLMTSIETSYPLTFSRNYSVLIFLSIIREHRTSFTWRILAIN